MHTLILSKRNSIAQNRIKADASLLADHFQVDPALVSALAVQEKDVLVKAMKEREAVANLLSAIAVTVGVKSADALVEETVTAVTDEAQSEADSEPLNEEGDDPTPKKTRSKKAS